MLVERCDLAILKTIIIIIIIIITSSHLSPTNGQDAHIHAIEKSVRHGIHHEPWMQSLVETAISSM